MVKRIVDTTLPVGRLTVYDRYRIWEGVFISGPSHEEYAAMKDSLRSKMVELEIAVEGRGPRGSRAATTEEITKYMLEERKGVGPRGEGITD